VAEISHSGAEHRFFPAAEIQLTGLRFLKRIRDPIYGYIYTTEQENAVMETQEFQRLDRLSQTPGARVVYPGATNTRKAHSLGTMHLIHKAMLHLLYRQCPIFRESMMPALYYEPVIAKNTKLLDSLESVVQCEWWNRNTIVTNLQTVRLAALLHDVGHGPFSHAFEEACANAGFAFDHEAMGVWILREKLKPHIIDPIKVDDVASILTKQRDMKRPFFVRELIDSPFDCDKLDYLNRDSYHAGTPEYGRVDSERIIDGFRVMNSKVLISSSAMDALMNSLGSYQAMYANVYFHHTCRIFEFMLADALKLVPDYVKKLATDMNVFLETDDMTIVNEIKHMSFQKSGDDKFGEAYEILKSLMDRKLAYKLIVRHTLTLSVARDGEVELEKLARELEEAGADIGVRVDFKARVKPIGVDPRNLLDWLTRENIFDEDDEISPVKSIETLNRAHYRALTQYQVLFNVFAHRKEAKSSEYAYAVKRTQGEAESALATIEKLQRMDRA
jgi:HD superfamily phosphohydrolase